MTELGTVRMAGPEDVSQIVTVIRSGFSEEDLQITTVGCGGYEQYVRAQIDIGSSGGDSTYCVATDRNDEAVACLEMRDLGAELFLNHIFVLPEHRRLGLGTRLLRHAVYRSRGDQCEMALDVWADNERAISWYEKMGFREQLESHFWIAPLPPRLNQVRSRLIGWPHALAGYGTYGFANFQIATSAKQYSVGLLGSLWFRVTDADALTDAELMDALGALEPGRSVLAVLPAGEMPGGAIPRLSLIRRAFRMHASLAAVADWLSNND
jgi:ribosomal protein S18 acetylase RimI-like enzyme